MKSESKHIKRTSYNIIQQYFFFYFGTWRKAHLFASGSNRSLRFVFHFQSCTRSRFHILYAYKLQLVLQWSHLFFIFRSKIVVIDDGTKNWKLRFDIRIRDREGQRIYSRILKDLGHFSIFFAFQLVLVLLLLLFLFFSLSGSRSSSF